MAGIAKPNKQNIGLSLIWDTQETDGMEDGQAEDQRPKVNARNS